MSRRSSLQEFIKAQKNQQDKPNDEIDTVEVLVSSKRYTRKPVIQQHNVEMITVLTCFDHKFIVPKPAACMSGCIKMMLDGCGSFIESTTGIVRLPEIRPQIFEKIMNYLVKEWMFNSNRGQKIVFGVEVDDESVMELLLACHYLDLPSLMETTCKMLAENIERLSSLEFFPEEAVQEIYRHTEPILLTKLEIGCKDKTELGAPIALPKIWMEKYKNLGWVSDRSNWLMSYLPCFNMNLPPFNTIAHVLPDTFPFFNIPFSEDDIDWKEEFIQREMQRLLHCFVSEETDIEDLKSCIEIYSPYVKLINLPGTILSENILSLENLLKGFPSLHTLSITGYEMNLDQIQVLCDCIPIYNKNLRSLILSNISATDSILIKLCQLLKKHPLESLDISENMFFHQGLNCLADTLKENKYLKCLSLHSNQFPLNSQSIPRYHSALLPHWQRINITEPEPVEQITDDITLAGDAIMSCFEFNDTLEVLDIGFNELYFSEISRNSWNGLKKNQKLKSLLLQGNFIGNESNFNLFMYLPESLECLNISRCTYDEREELVNGLTLAAGNLNNIKTLDLSELDLGYINSFPILVRAISSLPFLKSIDLSRNKFNSSHGNSIGTMVAQHQSLIFLRIIGNSFQRNVLSVVLPICESKDKRNITVDCSSNNIPFETLKQMKVLPKEHSHLHLLLE